MIEQKGGEAMWIKLVIGAIAGLVVGHFVTPGYALWVLLGIILGYIVDIFTNPAEKTAPKSTSGRE